MIYLRFNKNWIYEDVIQLSFVPIAKLEKDLKRGSMDKKLRYFKAIAEYNSISMASEKVSVSQPALTRSIKKLEDQLGVELFNRLPKGMTLTKYGSILLHRVNSMEKEYKFALKEIKAVQKGENARLVIGSDNLWGEYYLNDILSLFTKKYPMAEIRVKAGPVSSLFPELVEGKIDVLLGNVDFDISAHNHLVKSKLVDVNFVVIGKEDHPLQTQKTVTAEDLSLNNWVIYQQSDNYQWHIDNYLYKYGTTPAKIVLHTAFLPQAIAEMKKHNHLMYIPHKLVDVMSKHGLKPLPQLQKIHSFNSGVIYHDKSLYTPSLNSFISILYNYFK